jgi:hypothetical protein
VLAISIIVATALTLFGSVLGFYALRALRLVRRIRGDKTSKLSVLAAGPVELVVELRAADPVLAFDGSRAVAVERSISYEYTKNGETSYAASATHTECALVEARDESGARSLAMDQAVLLGPKRRYVFTPKDFRERYSKLWSMVVNLQEGETVEAVIAEEIAVPDGTRCFVSGTATLSDSPEHGEGDPARPALYRGSGERRFKLRGEPGRPLIVSAWGEEVVTGVLLRSTACVAWIWLLCWLVAALAIAIPLVMTARAGL